MKVNKKWSFQEYYNFYNSFEEGDVFSVPNSIIRQYIVMPKANTDIFCLVSKKEADYTVYNNYRHTGGSFQFAVYLRPISYNEGEDLKFDLLALSKFKKANKSVKILFGK